MLGGGSLHVIFYFRYSLTHIFQALTYTYDHTSVIRFMEQRFGVMEPNITPWRRAVCGDLTSAFDFTRPDLRPFAHTLPATEALAERSRALAATALPVAPPAASQPWQERGTRPSRALPYELHVAEHAGCESIALSFLNTGKAGAVFHVYDKHRVQQVPRRYTVEPGKELHASWAPRDGDGAYDLWVLGPNGFHRHYTGNFDGAAQPQVWVSYDLANGAVSAQLRNPGRGAVAFMLAANAYHQVPAQTVVVAPGGEAAHTWSVTASAGWYDFSVHVAQQPGYVRRFAGRVETGSDSSSDPAMGMETAWPSTVPFSERMDQNWRFLFQMMEDSARVSVAQLL